MADFARKPGKKIFTPEVHSLQDLSAIAIARFFWDSPTVIDMIGKYFDNYDKQPIYTTVGYDQDQPWREIIDFVKRKLEKLTLPENIFKKIDAMIILVGNKVFYWKKYVIKELLEFDVRLINEIRWTGLSTVDENKIFQECWCNHPFKYDFYKYVMASIFCQTDFIKDNMVEMVNKICGLYKFQGGNVFKLASLLKNQFSPFEIIAIYLCLFTGTYNDFSAGFQLFEDLIESNSPPGELFLMCLPSGLVKAGVYFYSRIKETDREEILLESAYELLKIDQNFPIYRQRKEKHAELFLFAINNMSKEKKRKKFLSENIIKVCDLFITVWPHQKLLLPIIDYVWDLLTESCQKELVNYFLDFLIAYSSSWFHHNKGIAQELLLTTLNKMKPELKYNVLIKNKNVTRLLEIKDFSSISMIFNDVDLKSRRNEIIQNFDSIFKEAAENKEMETLNLYFEGLNLTEGEQMILKRKYQ